MKGTMRMRLWCCLVGAGLLLAACTPARAPVDWASVEREGRTANEAKLEMLLAVQDYHFSDGELPLRYERTIAPLIEAPQLFVEGASASGASTTFIVDTGAGGTLIGARSSLARDVYVSRRRFQGIGYQIDGYLGYLPELRLGPLVGPDLAVAVAERAHARHAPSNILGIIQLFHTQIEHSGARWSMRSGTARLPARETGWQHVPLLQGTQLVHLRGPDGRVVVGMIDTGATDSFAVPPTVEGNYRLLAEDGTLVLTVPADDEVEWRDFKMGGRAVQVIIGMDVLAERDWRLSCYEGLWALAPAPTRR